MKFTEVFNRLTGISTPLGGISLQPQELEVTVARRVIGFLEDRRVLYSPDELEVPEHCVRSVMDIRRILTTEIGQLASQSEFRASLRAMRTACRKFLDCVGASTDERTIHHANHLGHWASWKFYSALGEMRGVFGVHLARIAAQFKLDIDDGLASILPAESHDGES